MLVSELIIRCAKDFSDYDTDGADSSEIYVSATLTDWVDFYNAALRQLVLARPDCNYQYSTEQLTANETRHSLPDAAVALIDIPRNMGTGSTVGTPIKRIKKEEIENMLSTWHSMTGETAIEFFAYDPSTPNHFYTYPRVHASTQVHVDMAYSYHFTEVAEADIATTDVACADRFIGAVHDWMLNLAFKMDTDSAPNWNASLRFEQAFYQSLGLEFSSKSSITQEPNK